MSRRAATIEVERTSVGVQRRGTAIELIASTGACADQLASPNPPSDALFNRPALVLSVRDCGGLLEARART
jgi:hypothetical protein